MRNITRRNLPGHAVDAMEYRSSSAFALMWNLCKDMLPEEIMGDFDAFFKTLKMLRMNSAKGVAKEFIASEGLATKGDYAITVGDTEFLFKNAELAPPSGVVGQNYSR